MTKEESIDAVRPKMTGCYQKIFIFWGLGQRELQALSNPEGVPSLGLNTVIHKDPLYQFLQPTIGGKGQFLKASCHREGLVKAALKGILWDSAAMNSRGSETPTGPRK
jgi:hypothetical protein